MENPKEPSPFNTWYQRHKEDFNAKRRAKYHQDKQYKQRVLEQAAKARRNRTRIQRDPKYVFNLAELADFLDITIWTLRNWYKNEYFPEPYKFNGELFFTEKQAELLKSIKNYLDTHKIKRLTAEQKIELNKIVGVIHSHWD